MLPSLIEGHQLNADGQHGVYDNAEIKPYWQQSFKTIDNLVAQAITYYENGDFANAKKSFQQAQYDGYKNSEMEMSVRTNRSSENFICHQSTVLQFDPSKRTVWSNDGNRLPKHATVARH